MPKIIKQFQKDYPGIDYEMLLGDYTEIRSWIAEGRVDCGFLCLPTDPQLILQKIPYKVIIKPLEKPVFRKIGVAMKSKKTASAVTKKFLEYLKYRS